ncbi:MAG: YdcF family protein [Symbiobacteriia bacterium]
MLISQIEPEQLSRPQVTRLLFGEPPTGNQPPVAADCIFVFGGTQPERVVTAARLYQAGTAPLLLCSGGTKWGQRQEPEAVTMRRQALSLGVPDKDIVIETESNHTKENVLASLLVLDRAIGLQHLRRVLAVSSPSHMRRCLLTLRTYMPRWIEFAWQADDRTWARAENWWQNPQDEARIRKEARSLVAYVREGQLLDEEVELGQ